MDLQKTENIVDQRNIVKTNIDLLECNLLKHNGNIKLTKSLVEKIMN